MQQSINGAVKAFMTFISYAENFFSKCHISILSEMESGKPAPITHYKCHELLLNKVVTIVITQKAYQTDCQSHNKCGKRFFKATLATFGPFGYLSKCMANLATFK